MDAFNTPSLAEQQQMQDRAQIAQQMAQTPSGAQINAAQLTGQLPGQIQEAQRQQLADSVIQKQTQDAQQAKFATLQNYPLTPGNAPTLSPLEQQDAQAKGLTPQQYVLNRRAAGSPEAQSFIRSGTTSADALAADPRFQNLATSHPDHAAYAFQAITGQDYGTYAKTALAEKQKMIQSGIDYFQKGLQDQTLMKQDDGSILSQQMIPDPLGSGKMIRGDKYVPLNNYQKQLLTPEVAAGVFGAKEGERTILAHRRLNQPQIPPQPDLSENLTVPQADDVQPQQNVLQRLGTRVANTAGAITSGIGASIQNAMHPLTTSNPYPWNLGEQGLQPVVQGALGHANSSQMRAMYKNDPKKAMQLIQAIRSHGLQQAQQPEEPGVEVELAGP